MPLEFFWVYASLFVVDAHCPNLCSGHGECGTTKTSVCDCFAAWNAAPDCSLRSCPQGAATVSRYQNTSSRSYTAECSNNGFCDRSTGTCTCLAGYTGAACQRRDCSCNGHGRCMTAADIGKDFRGVTYSNWENDMWRMCFCDWGYTGPDCSLRMCPKGDDPMTGSQHYRSILITTGGSSTALAGEFTLHFNGFSTSWNADGSQINSDCTTAICTALGNVQSCGCTQTSLDSTTKGATYNVTLYKYSSQGYENNILYHQGAPPASHFRCDTSGVTSSNSPTCSISLTGAVYIEDSKYKEFVYCSGRGTCDFSTGVCTCYSGYGGSNCDTVANVASTADNGPGFEVSATVAGAAYTGDAIKVNTAKAAANDFNMFAAYANNAQVFQVRGDGYARTSNGLKVDAGGLTVSAGGMSILSGGISADGGASLTGGGVSVMESSGGAAVAKFSSNATSAPTEALLQLESTMLGDSTWNLMTASVSSTTTVFTLGSDGAVTTYGNGVASFGAGITTNGSLTVGSGGATVSSGGVTVSSGDLMVGGGHITVSDGTLSLTDASHSPIIHASNTDLDSGTNSSAAILKLDTMIQSHPFIDCRVDNTSAFEVAGSGATTVHSGGFSVVAGGLTVSSGGGSVAGGLTVASGGLTVSAGGTTVTSGGATVVDGGSSITNSADAGIGLLVTSSGSSFASDVLKLDTSGTSPTTNFNYIHAIDNSDNSVFKVSGNGDVIALTGSFKCSTTSISAPDYVFEPDYPLMPLQDVEEYYLKHKHLPNVTSAADMAKSPLDLRDFTMTLLEKVEELTLHMVAMSKEMNELRQRVQELENA